MTLLAIDGRFTGQTLAYVPPGYHCVMHLDNHPDIISCHPDYMRDQFIGGVWDGLEAFTDAATALRMLNNMRHGYLTVLASQIVRSMVSTNLTVFNAQQEARNNERS